jgi:hypothetical protein
MGRQRLLLAALDDRGVLIHRRHALLGQRSPNRCTKSRFTPISC